MSDSAVKLIAGNVSCVIFGCFLAWLSFEHGSFWAGAGSFLCMISIRSGKYDKDDNQ